MKDLIISVMVCVLSCFMLFSCQRYLYKDELSTIVGIDQVQIENIYQIDEFGGFGEGKLVEIYTLSELTIKAFVLNPNKTLSAKDNWVKKDWETNSCDTISQILIDNSLNYLGGKTISQQLIFIKDMLSLPNIYMSFYYNETNPELSTKIQMFVLDASNRKLYIVDTVN